jgi:hypothetical protein
MKTAPVKENRHLQVTLFFVYLGFAEKIKLSNKAT